MNQKKKGWKRILRRAKNRQTGNPAQKDFQQLARNKMAVDDPSVRNWSQGSTPRIELRSEGRKTLIWLFSAPWPQTGQPAKSNLKISPRKRGGEKTFTRRMTETRPRETADASIYMTNIGSVKLNKKRAPEDWQTSDWVLTLSVRWLRSTPASWTFQIKPLHTITPSSSYTEPVIKKWNKALPSSFPARGTRESRDSATHSDSRPTR